MCGRTVTVRAGKSTPNGGSSKIAGADRQILDTHACTRSARWCAAGGQARAPAHANRRKLGKSVWLENTSRFY